MLKDALRLHSLKDKYIGRGRVILTKGHGNKYMLITGEDGFNTYDRTQVRSFVDQLNELTESDYDIKDKEIRKELRKISSVMSRSKKEDEPSPASFYFRLPDMPNIDGMAK